jgi:hypothetical protein
MLSQGLSLHNTPMTVTGLVIFLTAFAIIALWTFRKNSKKYYSKIEKLPLEDDET